MERGLARVPHVVGHGRRRPRWGLVLSAMIGTAMPAPFTMPALAQEPGRPPSFEAPATAEEHERLAEEYRRKAATYRLEAVLHREMKTAYQSGAAPLPKGTARPSRSKLLRHCETFARQADRLAAEAEFLAALHRTLAEELRGAGP